MNGCRRHPPEVQPEDEMPVIQAGLMLLNPLNEIAWSAKPQLVAFLQLTHFVPGLTVLDAVVLVYKILQHGFSPLPLCLSSCWGDAGIEDEWEFIPAGSASRGE